MKTTFSISPRVKKLIGIILLVTTSTFFVTYADFAGVKTRLGAMIASESGDFGYILTNMFDVSTGKIRSEFLDPIWTLSGTSTYYNSGSVGIGTASPMRQLHLSSPAGSSEMILEVANGLANYRKWNFVVDGGSGVAQNMYARILNDAGTGTSQHGMTWFGNGNVGMGYTPKDALTYFDINNTHTGSSAGAIMRFITNNAANTGVTTADVVKYRTGLMAINNYDGDISFGTKSNTRMTVTGSGNVGIGTGNPATNLHINNGNYAAIQLGNDVTGQGYHISKETSGLLGFWAGKWGAGNLTMALTQSGGIGMGLIPTENVTRLQLANNTAEMIKMQNTLSNGGTWQFKVGGGGWYDGNFFIVDKTGGADNHRFTIDGSGNVGIGTTTPSSLPFTKFAVDGGAVTISNSDPGFTTEGGQMRLRAKNSTKDWNIDNVNNGAGTMLRFFHENSDTSGGQLVMMIDSNTNRVGIGTASPDQTLSVNGNASKVGGGSWATFSDRRLKDINNNYTRGLSEVLKINPISYNYKKDNPLKIDSSISHIGVVAQEIEKVIPEAITKTKSGYLMVDNDPIIWALLNSVKEQQKQIETQQKQIDELKKLIKK